MVIDTDGSAFITKAEFDSLKNNFQAQIDNYNNSIDSKIDGAIAAYLSGVGVAQEMVMYYNDTSEFKFKNYLESDDFRADEGIYNINATRVSTINGLTSVSVGGGSWTYYKPIKRHLCIEFKENVYNSNIPVSPASLVNSCGWSLQAHMNATTDTDKSRFVSFRFNDTSIALLSSNLNTPPSKSVVASWVADFLGITKSYNTSNCSLVWATIFYFQNFIIKKGEAFGVVVGTDTNAWTIYGRFEPPKDSTPTRTTVPAANIQTFNDTTCFGKGFGVNAESGVKYLNNYYSTCSIMNNIETQQYRYQDHSNSSYDTQSTSWDDDGSSQTVTVEPDENWNFQDDGTKQPLTHTGTTNTTYKSFQATKLQIPDETIWSSNCQLGSINHTTSIRTFDESCPMQVSSLQEITTDQTKFNRTGYYLDASGNLITNNNNVVKSGKISYKKLTWASSESPVNDIALKNFSSSCGELVKLGGGIALVQTPTERNDVKVKLNYEVTKKDGMPIDTGSGNIDIVIELSNKQFKNGNVNAPGVSLGKLTKTVNNTSASDSWTSNAFSLDMKGKLWINAYAVQKGYNVVIKNIDVK